MALASPDEQAQPADFSLELEEDHYAERLASLNEDNAVVATQDICNSHGAILVKKGARIDRGMSDRILKHKLFAPLEEQVKLSDEIDGSSLGEHARTLFEKYPDLRHLHEVTGIDPIWRLMTEEYSLPPVLWQKITVLQHEMPQEYEKSIFCAWLAVMIGREMGLDEGKIESLYMAGFAHDLGLLHIDPCILQKKGPLEPPEWRAIQSHVVVGQLMIENMPGCKPEVAQAILEHHERCDGTGYPAKKSDRHLRVLGLVVGMADSLQAIRMKQFESVGRNLLDAVPWLRMNTHTYSYPVYQAMDRLLTRSGLTPSLANPCDSEKGLLVRILERAENLQVIVDQLEKLQNQLEISAITPRGQDLLRALYRTDAMILSSGLLKEELLSWLRSVADIPEQSVLGELSEIDLMLNELRWQLGNLCRAFAEFYEQDCRATDGTCHVVKATMDTLLNNLG